MLTLAILCGVAGVKTSIAQTSAACACVCSGAAAILQQLADSCRLLRDLPKPATTATSTAAAQANKQLLASTQQLLGLLKDLWCALKVLGGLGSQQAEAGVAAAAGAAAECGCSLLAGLVAASRCLGEQDVAVKGKCG